MGLFDTVKKILFDEEEIEDLPVRNDKKDEKELKDAKESGGVIIHNEEDTITEVKVPEEKPTSLVFPVRVDDEIEDTTEHEIKEIQSRLDEDEINRTQQIERVHEENLTRSKSDFINEYNENRRLQRETSREPIRDYHEVREETVEKAVKTPYKVPPVISPVFGVLDKNYDPDKYEETREKITMSNSGTTANMSERQYGPVSYNDVGIPLPKYHKETTVIIATSADPTKELHDELKRESEALKEVNKIEDEIINTIINDEVEPSIIEEEKPSIEEEIEEPTVEFEEPVVEEPEETEEVITGSPYDDMLDAIDEEKQPTVDINELINNSEPEEEIVDKEDKEDEAVEANVPIDEVKDKEENVNLDDTIETDLYNLIDSMYSDED